MATNDGFDRPEEEESADSEIKVTDRRLFTSEGALREEIADEGTDPEAASGESPPPPPADPPEDAASAPSGEQGFEHRPLEEPEGVDFTMMINAMAQQALIFLGEIPIPGSDGPQVHLEQARFQIDLLDLLRIKCRGNLTPDEESLLDRMLYQLRMLYVSRSDQPTG